MDFQLGSFDLANSAVEVQDNSRATPAAVAVDALGVRLKNLRTVGGVPASLTVNGKIRSGGMIAVNGALDLKQSQVTTEVSIDQIDLPALQPFAQSVLAATIASGKLSAKANVQTHFASDHFNVHAEPATVAIENFEMDAPREREKPVQWKSLSVAIGQFDLAAHHATVTEVRGDGMHLFVRRERGGKLSLASLIRGSSPPAQAPRPRSKRASMREPRRMPRETKRVARKPIKAAPPPSQSWQYQIASVAMEQTDATFEDDNAPQPVKAVVAPLNLHLKDV